MTAKGRGHKFSVAVSRVKDPQDAGLALAEQVSQDLRSQTIDLAFLFLSSHHIPHAEALAKVVCEGLRPGLLLGCSGEGIIAGTEEIEGMPAVTLWAGRLPGVHVTPLRLSHTTEDVDSASLIDWPETEASDAPPPVFFLLADPFSTPMNDVLSAVSDRFPGAVAIGGLAGGGHDLGENRMVLNEEVFDGGLVGAALWGALDVRTVISQGCRPIGDRYIVTKAEHNVVHELGGKPALEQLQCALESLSSEDQKLAHHALHVGIVIDEHRNRFERGDFLVRNLIGADRSTGSVAIGEIVQAGQTIQFHVRDARAASEDLSLLVAADREQHPEPPLGALVFSCCGRGRGLFGQANHDISVVRKEMGDIPIAGFFAQGEIGPVGGSNFLHGYTASVALFCSPPS